jgi:hypothetical protein
MVVTDRNGPVVEFWDMLADRVTAFELPSGFVIERLTVGGE